MIGMASNSVQTFTILFVDVAGSVALYESLGDLAAKLKPLQDHPNRHILA